MAHSHQPTPQPNLELAEQDNGLFQCTVPDHLCVGRAEQSFLFGGCALAAAIETIERATGRPAIQASALFAASAHPGQTIVFAPTIVSAGRSISHTTLTATADDRLFLTAQATTGRRNDPTLHPGRRAPSVPPLEGCKERSVARLLSSNVNALFAVWLAEGELPDRAGWTGTGGRDLVCWFALRAGGRITRGVLAIISDCAALAIPGALGRPASGTSLDNAIRFAGEPDCDAVVAAFRVEAIRDGLAHVSACVHAPDGTVLALAQQTMVLRAGSPAVRSH